MHEHEHEHELEHIPKALRIWLAVRPTACLALPVSVCASDAWQATGAISPPGQQPSGPLHVERPNITQRC